MPLPTGDIAWPPHGFADALGKMSEHEAWWSGDPGRLEQAYGSGAMRPAIRDSQLAGGLVGRAARWWWGTPSTEQTRTRRHIPLASDISETSAALLFSQPPSFSVEGDTAMTGRLDTILNTPAVHSRLLESGELCSALGGVGMRVVWDRAVADHAFLDVVDADHVIPEHRWGQLVAVTFVTILPAPDSRKERVWRWLERHEVDPTLGAVVRHGLYDGTKDRLGNPQPYEVHPQTAHLAAMVVADGQTVVTGSTRLTAAYVPNVRPNRDFRGRPGLEELGRSDYAGIEPVFDALDETWSSLMRDIDLGKGRITVPDYMLQNLGPGRGSVFDSDRTIYSALRGDPRETNSGASADLVVSQFQIRVEEHLATAEALTRTAVKSAGYSPLTFGLVDEVAMTATETSARERATYRARDAKCRYFGAALGPLLAALLEVDAAAFPGRGGGRPVDVVKVEWPDAAQDPPSVRAQTVALLRQAEAVSTRQAVAMVHTDWDDTRLDQEAARIMAEQGMGLPDPIGAGETDPV